MPPPIVLTMNPDCREAWRDFVPGALALEIQTPPGGWHRGPPDTAAWEGALQSLEGQVRRVQQHAGAELSVFAQCPYSLGFLLGRRLEAYGSLCVYQLDNAHLPDKAWRPWGPRGVEEDPTGAEVFLPPALPAADAEAADVVLVVQVTLSALPAVEGALPGLGLAGAPCVLLGVPTPRQGALEAQRAGAAERQIWDTLQQLRDRWPRATLHLFYSGPVALAIRVGRRLHIGGRAVVLYEFIQGGYLPRVRLPEGLPLWRSPGDGILPLKEALEAVGPHVLLASPPPGWLVPALQEARCPVVVDPKELGRLRSLGWPVFRAEEPEARELVQGQLPGILLHAGPPEALRAALGDPPGLRLWAPLARGLLQSR